LNGVADLLQQDQITLQTVYDYIKNIQDEVQKEATDTDNNETLLLEGKE
jgi:hypothetical protein